ncbi:hypothetical protein [Spirosoma pulveris]
MSKGTLLDLSAVTIFILIFCAILVYAIFMFNGIYRKQHRYDNRVLQIVGLINLPSIDDKDKLLLEDDLKFAIKEIRERQPLSVNKEGVRLFEKIILTLFLVNSFFYFIIGAFYFSIAIENIRFHNAITIVKPYLKDVEVDLLESKWLLMRNKNDYKSIHNSIDKTLKLNKIDLKL